MTFDPKTAKFGGDFNPSGVTVLTTVDKDPVVSYVGDWKGEPLLHIRWLYQDRDGSWKPGKGIALPVAKGKEFLHAVAALIKEDTDKSPAPAPAAKAKGKKVKAVA